MFLVLLFFYFLCKQYFLWQWLCYKPDFHRFPNCYPISSIFLLIWTCLVIYFRNGNALKLFSFMAIGNVNAQLSDHASYIQQQIYIRHPKKYSPRRNCKFRHGQKSPASNHQVICYSIWHRFECPKRFPFSNHNRVLEFSFVAENHIFRCVHASL